MIVLGVDPSGEFEKGKGTTGLAVVEVDGNKTALHYHSVIAASECNTRLHYWRAIYTAIRDIAKRYDIKEIVIEDYVLYGSSAKAQINSGMETSKLIGMLMYNLSYICEFKVHLNIAANVMNRWTNKILEHEGIISLEGTRAYDSEHKHINKHALDAIRHATHGAIFLVKKCNHIT